MLFVFYLFNFLAVAESTSSFTSVDSEVAVSSPYASCQNRKRKISNSIEINTIREFYKDLQKKVEENVEDNIAFADEMIRCFNVITPKNEQINCEKTRNWFDPEKYPLENGVGAKKSLKHAVKLARVHLALASQATRADQLLVPNKELVVFGFKNRKWNPLSKHEYEEVQRLLSIYKTTFLAKNNLSEMELLESIRLRSKLYPDNSPDEVRRRVVRAEFERQLSEVRQKHLAMYRHLVSQFPIINFMSSENPSSTEVLIAAQQIKKNGINELEGIKSIGVKFEDNLVSPPDEAVDLLDYMTVVDSLLAEKPQYCTLATSIHSRRVRVDNMEPILRMTPLLAASYFGSPLVALGALLGTSGLNAYAASADLEKKKQLAYSVIKSESGNQDVDGSQVDVDNSHAAFKDSTDLRLILVDAAFVGSLGTGISLLKRFKKTISKSN